MIIYNGPVGEPIENPSQEFIRDLIFTKNESYWKQGSGDSCLEVEGSQERLIFFMMNHMDFL